MLITHARGMRKQPSRAERAVWEIVRDRRIGAKFRRQHPVEGYIADFAAIDAKLIVEVDGRSHDAQQDYDAARDAALKTAGWRVLRVRDDDVLGDPGGVERVIKEALTCN
jgi:very-short-patch-repair endonuclease